MIVVSDTSPILNLSVIGRLELLNSLYGDIVVPPTVAQELSISGFPLKAPWIIVRAADNQSAVRELKEVLDPGESEAIIIAQETSADLLLIDERRGRKIATARSLKCIGLLGVLAEAKRKCIINQCGPLLEAMIDKAGFWIGSQLKQQFLTGVDET